MQWHLAAASSHSMFTQLCSQQVASLPSMLMLLLLLLLMLQ
jgi:hypothetical protein